MVANANSRSAQQTLNKSKAPVPFKTLFQNINADFLIYNAKLCSPYTSNEYILGSGIKVSRLLLPVLKTELKNDQGCKIKSWKYV